jgi:hypothetical protein
LHHGELCKRSAHDFDSHRVVPRTDHHDACNHQSHSPVCQTRNQFHPPNAQSAARASPYYQPASHIATGDHVSDNPFSRTRFVANESPRSSLDHRLNTRSPQLCESRTEAKGRRPQNKEKDHIPRTIHERARLASHADTSPSSGTDTAPPPDISLRDLCPLPSNGQGAGGRTACEISLPARSYFRLRAQFGNHKLSRQRTRAAVAGAVECLARFCSHQRPAVPSQTTWAHATIAISGNHVLVSCEGYIFLFLPLTVLKSMTVWIVFPFYFLDRTLSASFASLHLTIYSHPPHPNLRIIGQILLPRIEAYSSPAHPASTTPARTVGSLH